MSRDCCSSLFFGCLLILSPLIILASIIVGSIGAASYVKEKHDELVYKPTMCFVANYTVIAYTCSRQQCDTTGSSSTGFNRHCTTVYDTCYIKLYVVIYNVSDGRQLQSVIKTNDGPGKDSINQTLKCYYDSTDVTSVRWTWPNSYQYLIMLCVGWSIVGFYILLISGLITCCQWKQLK